MGLKSLNRIFWINVIIYFLVIITIAILTDFLVNTNTIEAGIIYTHSVILSIQIAIVIIYFGNKQMENFLMKQYALNF